MEPKIGQKRTREAAGISISKQVKDDENEEFVNKAKGEKEAGDFEEKKQSNGPISKPPLVDKQLFLRITEWNQRVKHTNDNNLTSTSLPAQPSISTLLNMFSACAKMKNYNGEDEHRSLKTSFAFHSDMLKHQPPHFRQSDCELPGRVSISHAHLEECGLLSCCERISFGEATNKELELVHEEQHITHMDSVFLFAGDNFMSPDSDLYFSQHTARAARLAAGGVIAAALSVVRKEAENSFALIRPPGHHCCGTRPKGFCFFNNVACAARVAQQEILQGESEEERKKRGGRSPRVMIIDWDVHHCDGTEQIFYDDPSVLVFSVHQFGFHPPHQLSRHLRNLCKKAKKKSPSVEEEKEEADEDELADLLPSDVGCLQEEEEDDVLFKHMVTDQPVELEKDDGDLIIESAAKEGAQENNSLGELQNEGETRPRRNRKPIQFDATDEDADAYFGALGLNGGNSANSSSSESQSLGSRPSSSNGCQHSNTSSSSAASSWPSDWDEQRYPPFYPGTGYADKVGTGEGEGCNVNFPWPTVGFGDMEYLYVLKEIAVPLAQEFQPDLVLVSCGFDCAQNDTLGSMKVSPSGFYALVKLLMEEVTPHLVVALEGGYNLKSVALSAEGVLRALLSGQQGYDADRSRMLIHQAHRQVQTTKELLAPYWKCFRQST